MKRRSRQHCTKAEIKTNKNKPAYASVVVISIQGTLDIKPGGANPGPAITLGAELVDSSVNEVRNFESRGTAALPSTTQDKSGGRGLLIAEPIIAIGDTLGSLDFDDGGQRSNSRDQRGVLSGAGSGFLLRLGLASRLRDYSLDFGAYEFGDYRFQMGRISFAQQMTGRGLGIGGGDTSVTSSTERAIERARRSRPPRDIARGFTGWEMSLQLRADGSWANSWLTNAKQPPSENAPTPA